MGEMTMRERMLAVVQGRPHDRVPFVQYGDLAGPREAIWSALGRQNMGILQWVSPFRLRHPHCRFETIEFQRDGQRGFERTLHTPAGSLTEIKVYEPTYATAATRRHFVRRPGDYKVLLAYFRDVTVVKDLAPLAEAVGALGDDGLPHVALPRTPYQQLWVEWVCIEDLCLHLADEPALMDEVVAAMMDVARQVIAIAIAVAAAGEAPIPYLVFPDNITAPMIGLAYFQKYCAPLYRQLTEDLDAAGLDVPVAVHMDGDLKPLWAAIGESGIRGLDSMSPPPDNDTSVADAMRLWPEMRVGVNFPSSVHLKPPEQVYAAAAEILDQGGRTGRLQIQISENVPPGRWRVSFPPIIRAIRDFGRAGP